MTYPYGLCSDQHCHDWSQFATTAADGINSRLAIQLQELQRCADAVDGTGGDTLYFAGDLFHVRGKIDPEVFNPTHTAIRRILERIFVIAIPGNHDLKGKETTEIGNAIQTLGGLDRFDVVTKSFINRNDRVAMVPWQPTVEATREAIKLIAARVDAETGKDRGDYDLIIHAPVNDVIPGIPDTGLSGAELLDLGFHRVFAGHYHNHKMVAAAYTEDRSVYSIGATTHQTWSDIGTKAGFLLVYEDRVEFRASHAPRFVEITAETEPGDIPLIADGNYVRVRFDSLSEGEAKQWREELTGMGAKGVVVMASKAPAVSRTGSTAKSGASLEASIGGFIKGLSHPREPELTTLCLDILSKARSAE